MMMIDLSKYPLMKVFILDNIYLLRNRQYKEFCEKAQKEVRPKCFSTQYPNLFRYLYLDKGIDLLTYDNDKVPNLYLRNTKELTEINIPSNIRAIGDYSFYRCDNLKSVTLNEGLEEIGSVSFSNCSALEEIKIPSTVTVVGKHCLWSCPSLKKVYVPRSLTQEFEDNAEIFVDDYSIIEYY